MVKKEDFNEHDINGWKAVLKHEIKERWKNVTPSTIRKVTNYMKNNELSLIDGGVLKQFEDEFANYIGAKYAVAYCNGTAALHAASYACGADDDSIFISSIYSYHGTILSILENRAKVRLVDYEDDYFTIDLNEVEKNLDKNVKGLLITHCWGNIADYEKLMELKRKYNIKIIVDASHAHGAKFNNIKVGNISCEDVVCFSLGKNKLMSAGELGVAVTNDKDLYEKMLFMGHPNRVPSALSKDSKLRYYSNGIGNKYRPHALALVLGIDQIKRFNKKLKDNVLICEKLSNEINNIDGFYVPKVHKNCSRVFWKLHVFIDKKYWKDVPVEKVIKAIRAEGLILEQFHNYNIVEQLKIWTNKRYDNQIENRSKTRNIDNVIVLPGYINISKKDYEKIVKVFKKVSKMKGLIKW